LICILVKTDLLKKDNLKQNPSGLTIKEHNIAIALICDMRKIIQFISIKMKKLSKQVAASHTN